MRVLKIEPSKAPIVINIANELSVLQGQVGGHIEVIPWSSDVAIICDEEGKLRDKPYNFRLFGDNIVGVALVAGVKDGEFRDLQDADVMWWQHWLPHLRWGDGR